MSHEQYSNAAVDERYQPYPLKDMKQKVPSVMASKSWWKTRQSRGRGFDMPQARLACGAVITPSLIFAPVTEAMMINATNMSFKDESVG